MRILVLVPALLALPVAAAEPQVGLVAGFGVVDRDVLEASFEEYLPPRDGFLLDRLWLRHAGPRWMAFLLGRNLRRSNESFELSVSGTPLSLAASLDRVPHVYSRWAKTPYEQPSPGIFTLPDSFRAGVEADPSTFATQIVALAARARLVPLETSRERSAVEFTYRPSRLLRMVTRVQRETRAGSRAGGAAFGFNNVVQLPESVDHRTLTGEVHVEANDPARHAQAEWNWLVQRFDNRIPQLVLDNPRRLTDDLYDPSHGIVDLAPANRFESTHGSLAVHLPGNTHATLAAGAGRGTQDDPFLPYTANTAIVAGSSSLQEPPFSPADPASLPARSLRGKVDSSFWAARARSRPLDPVEATFSLREERREDRSLPLAFPGLVVLDQAWSERPAIANRFGLSRRNREAGLAVRPHRFVRIETSAGDEQVSRANREVPGTTERYGQVRWQMRGVGGRYELRGTAKTSRRRMGRFDLDAYRDTDGGPRELPGLRRWDVADRDRLEGSMWVSAAPRPGMSLLAGGRGADSRFLPSGDLAGGRTDFDPRLYGRLEDRSRSAFARAESAWSWGSASVSYDWEELRLKNRSNVSGGALAQDAYTDWESWSRDTSRLLRMELRAVWPDLGLEISVGFDRASGHGLLGLSDLASTTVRESPPPETRSVREVRSAGAAWEAGPGFRASVEYRFERFRTEDFAENDVPLVGGRGATGAVVPNAIYLGDSLRPYRAHVVGLTVTREW